MQRDSVYYVQRGVNLLIGVNRLGTQSRVRSIYYLWLHVLTTPPIGLEDYIRTIPSLLYNLLGTIIILL